MNYLFLAPGFEEIEAVAPVDILRRASMEVKTVSILPGERVVEGTHGVPYVADLSIDEMAQKVEADWLIFPGGMPGAVNLYNCSQLMEMLLAHNGHIAAICASPAIILGQLGLLEGKRATCYPGMEGYCKGATMTGEHVSIDGRILTGQGPAWASAFGLAIVAETLGSEKAKEVADAMLF